MGLKAEWIRYGSEGYHGYLCFPDRASAPLPSIVVLQEAWGVNAHIEDVTRRFARAGYAALAPDFYAKNGERPPALAKDRLVELLAFFAAVPTALVDPKAREAALAEKNAAERARLSESLGAMSGHIGKLSSFVPMLLDTTRWLRSEHALTRGQRVGSVGYCMGGGLSALLAAHDPDLAAAVVYYGTPPPLDLVAGIRCPLLGLYGELDQRITPQVRPFEEAMKRAGKRFEAVVYDGAQHAFFNDDRPTYDARASRDAFARTLVFLRSELGG
jgi:carboxymethylenebutenolidase